MNKFVRTSLAVVVLALCTGVLAYSDNNLMTNGSFETGGICWTPVVRA